jgi:hypothetical protein
MAKIYPRKEDVNKMCNNENGEIGEIIFNKKYYKIHDYLMTFTIFPVVLIPIIMNYVNDVYTVEYVLNDTVNINTMCIKRITKNNQEHILNYITPYYCGIYYYLRLRCLDILSGSSLFTTHTEIDNQHTNKHYLAPWFNWFMEKYYNKKEYILTSQHDSSYSDKKIHNPKELRNIIVIFKILSKIVVRKN